MESPLSGAKLSALAGTDSEQSAGDDSSWAEVAKHCVENDVTKAYHSVIFLLRLECPFSGEYCSLAQKPDWKGTSPPV